MNERVVKFLDVKPKDYDNSTLILSYICKQPDNTLEHVKLEIENPFFDWKGDVDGISSCMIGITDNPKVYSNNKLTITSIFQKEN